MDLFERHSLHFELPELVRSREDGAEEDGTCPERCVGRELRLPQQHKQSWLSGSVEVSHCP